MERSEAVSLVNRAHYGKVRHKWVSHLRKELETTGGNWGFEEVGKGNRIFGELSEGGGCCAFNSLKMELKVRSSWLKLYGLENATLESLALELT